MRLISKYLTNGLQVFIKKLPLKSPTPTTNVIPVFQVSEDMRIGKKRRPSAAAYESSSEAGSNASTSPYQRRQSSNVGTPQISLSMYGEQQGLDNISYSTQTSIGIQDFSEYFNFSKCINMRKY